MDSFKLYKQEDIDKLLIRRAGEVKLAEKVQVVKSLDEMKSSAAKFVLLGIPEDIGVRANYGIAGAASTWKPGLVAILNIQSNKFLRGDELLVLGHFEIEEPKEGSVEGLRDKVSEIDDLVYPVIEKIVAAGKVPIIIGGGHNNAYPIIKGASIALKKPIDVLNIDAHADLRTLEGRHSGNGFSYALNDGFLNRYSIFGLHQNYNNEAILNQIEENPKLKAVFFDDVLKGVDYQDLLAGLSEHPGLEIDLDCIQNVLSSAETPSGFAVNDIRKLILAGNKKYTYLHLTEGASRMLDGRVDKLTSKLIAYLVSDFMKAQ
ncbi:formimidoylglutamase [Pedobacter punctiformis]|uniref:Formimidoylglutamase n=1 Tax=Pedobacter punctiformis TaxID=3004097 RepID=A0ABT4L5E6_9SPHI|nr:formimidoylglutamase [Pedobacter sp. HCMS5-2]MCZ4243145.1 formimidoylglutamase [Pedobacter sp. HCMS5-2]